MVVVIFASFFTLLILAVPIAMAMGFSTILPALIASFLQWKPGVRCSLNDKGR